MNLKHCLFFLSTRSSSYVLISLITLSETSLIRRHYLDNRIFPISCKYWDILICIVKCDKIVEAVTDKFFNEKILNF